MDLICSLNSSRKRSKLIDNLSSEIDIDDAEVQSCISSAGLNINSVVADGRIISLRRNSNISTGGIREEISLDDVHPRIKSQCLSIANTFRLDCCGIDYITSDISLDPLHHPGAFIEINYMPQHHPQRAIDLITNLFPESSCFSIPCSLIIANWDQVHSKSAIQCLEELITDKPSATFASHHSLKDTLLSALNVDNYDKLTFFVHPRQLVIDASISELICIITPHMLVRKGWIIPLNRLRIFNFVEFDGSPITRALFDYLDSTPLR